MAENIWSVVEFGVEFWTLIAVLLGPLAAAAAVAAIFGDAANRAKENP